MTHVIVIVGLPGSGKSTLAHSLGLPVIEDFMTNSRDIPSEDCVLDSVILTKPSEREAFVRDNPNISFEWIFFENNPDQCKINISHPARDKKVLRSTIDFFSRNYAIPQGVRARPVFVPK